MKRSESAHNHPEYNPQPTAEPPQPDIESLCAHAGQGRLTGDPLLTPIVQSTTYCQNTLNADTPHAYSRVSNPTVDALEDTLGQLENAPPAVCFASGMAAETALFLALLTAGDHVICGRAVYGGTTRLLEQILVPLGVECTFVDATNPQAIAAAVRDNTRLIHIETPANPTLELTDIAVVSRIAHAAGALVSVDNTFLTPLLQQPLDLGADITVSSTTKFIEGHSAALGGAVVSRDQSVLDRLRFIRKCTGAILQPLNAWLTIQGLKTLPIRLRRQSESALRIARRLEQHPAVSVVHYPGLDTAADRGLAATQHLGHHGAVLSFDFAHGGAFARTFLAALQRCRLVEHVGSVETLITHPATMTHADLTPAQRLEVGITDGLVRLSVGLEDPREIIEDIETALAVASAEAEAIAQEGGAACLTSA